MFLFIEKIKNNLNDHVICDINPLGCSRIRDGIT